MVGLADKRTFALQLLRIEPKRRHDQAKPDILMESLSCDRLSPLRQSPAQPGSPIETAVCICADEKAQNEVPPPHPRANQIPSHT